MGNRKIQENAKRSFHVPQNVVTSKRFRHGAALSQRARGLNTSEQFPYAPPEDWHEPSANRRPRNSSYRIIVQAAGPGYRHVLTPEEIHTRLAQLPAYMREPLDVIQLSRMTRKKRGFPCYGMQWGSTLYLYPIETSLVEFYCRPPKPAQLNEARMYGGRWSQTAADEWQLVWTEAAIKDFYLNNILIHELGHLLDNRNTSYTDRERYAEWFAIEHGYKQSRVKVSSGNKAKRAAVVRRHHAK